MFVLKGNNTTSQRLEGSPDINIRAAGDTNTQGFKAQADKVLQKVKDIFSWCLHSRGVGALIECVNNDIDLPL